MILRMIGVIILAAEICQAEGWPCFRSPSRQGVSSETHVPLKWSAAENVRWKTPIPGQSWASPIVWEQKKGMPRIPSFLYLEPYLFTLTESGIAYCLKADTGEVIWQERLGGSFFASPVAAESHIYFLSDDGDTVVIDVGPRFNLLARNSLGENTQASIAIAHGRLFIRTAYNLYCIQQPAVSR